LRYNKVERTRKGLSTLVNYSLRFSVYSIIFKECSVIWLCSNHGL